MRHCELLCGLILSEAPRQCRGAKSKDIEKRPFDSPFGLVQGDPDYKNNKWGQ